MRVLPPLLLLNADAMPTYRIVRHFRGTVVWPLKVIDCLLEVIQHSS